ncbi:hypothetical protein NC653_011245 [Populus alba x Populus x berolinensis]|uniref:Uncharacterized protein n=1 Tax=Populus alba x Populus x berolinensis TaxID=444605 RepID=A0AAD6R321_9ROSI|nr:hypothetical protein NC653_011245 [Populus alba x Populus x berolinensis]
MQGPDLLLEAIVVLRSAISGIIYLCFLLIDSSSWNPLLMDTTKSARDLIRFQGNRLNGTSCSRGLFIFQSNVYFFQ